MEKNLFPVGLGAVARQEVELEHLLEKVPPEHRGLLFERVRRGFHPQENTRILELAFAEVWAEKNDPQEYRPLLSNLMVADESDPRREFAPRNEREWQVASLVAATLIQWLPTTVGCSFLRASFERGGGKFHCELPETTN